LFVVTRAVRRAAAIVLEGLLPADCLLCSGWLPWRQAGGVCPGCWDRLAWAPGRKRPPRGPLAAVAWAADFGGDMRRLIHILKFERFDPLGFPLGRAAARHLPPRLLVGPPPRPAAAPPPHQPAPSRPSPAIPRPAIVVPVPLHWTRRLRRGYNPAHLLARGVAAELGLPLLTGALARRRGRHQIGLGRRERLASLAGVFAAPGATARHLRGRTILLVDDVLTTGATVEACAQALHDAGAERVVAFALARTRRTRRP
jgi:predicted amidophosphoribosyltransferase